MVTKQGVRVEGSVFIAPELSVHIGSPVLVHHDPEDFGKIWVFSADGSEFIAEAKNAERLGAERAEVAGEAKAYRDDERQPYKAKIKKLGGKLTAGDMNAARVRLYQQDNKIHALPRASEKISSPSLTAAEAVLDIPQETTPPPSEQKTSSDQIAPTEIFDLESARGWPCAINKDDATARFARARGLEGRKARQSTRKTRFGWAGIKPPPNIKHEKEWLKISGKEPST